MKELINKLKVIDKQDKTIGSTCFTAIRNGLFAILKYILAFLSSSLWLFINAIFYSIIAIARVLAVKDYLKVRREKDSNTKKQIQNKNYFWNGLLLVIMGLIYLIISIIMYNQTKIKTYSGYIVYGVAFVAFYSLGTSIYGMVKYKKRNTPIIKATKLTNYATSMVSIVTTQIVLLNEFGGTINYNKYNGISGTVVSIVIVSIGIYMMLTTNKEKDVILNDEDIDR